MSAFLAVRYRTGLVLIALPMFVVGACRGSPTPAQSKGLSKACSHIDRGSCVDSEAGRDGVSIALAGGWWGWPMRLRPIRL